MKKLFKSEFLQNNFPQLIVTAESKENLIATCQADPNRSNCLAFQHPPELVLNDNIVSETRSPRTIKSCVSCIRSTL